MLKRFFDLLIYQVDLLVSSVRPMTAEEHDRMDEFFEEGMYRWTDDELY